MIYDRKTGEISEEKVFSSHAMHILYSTTLGGICLTILRLPIVNKIYGVFQKGKRSKKKIGKLAKDYDLGRIQGEYSSFNDYITRKESRIFERDANVFIAPADSCLLVQAIDDGVIYKIKGRNYPLSHLLKDEKLAREYQDGLCLIFRLRVYDYHRFCFVDDGIIQSERRINGFLDSVNMLQTGKFTLSSNYRQISGLKTSNFGDILFFVFVAMLVGRIVHTYSDMSFQKGDEKGYFEFGGSSIVLLLKKDAVQIDEDILLHSSKGIETKVEYGERIGIVHA
jgi:phosphatidylserine decarboxylase